MSLNALLDQGVELDPHYIPSMNSDHLPMTLCAMAGLGGDQLALVRHREQYLPRLRKIETVSMLRSWRDGIGRREEYPGLRQYLLNEVRESGIAETVASYLPEFLPSLAFEAFHPMIRLGYAIEAKHQGEVANALAYWITSHRDVPIQANDRMDFCGRLQEQSDEKPAGLEGRFGQALQTLIETDSYPVGIAENFEACAMQSLHIYRATRNFFALHMVTATLAARICAPLVDQQILLASLTGALLAAHKILGSPEFSPRQATPPPTRLDAEHCYKYAYACVSEHRAYGQPRYLDEIDGFKKQGLLPAWVISG